MQASVVAFENEFKPICGSRVSPVAFLLPVLIRSERGKVGPMPADRLEA